MKKYITSTADNVSVQSNNLVVNNQNQAVLTLYKIAHLGFVIPTYYDLVDSSHDIWDNEGTSVSANLSLDELIKESQNRHLDYIHLLCDYKDTRLCVSIVLKNGFPTSVHFVGNKNTGGENHQANIQEVLEEFVHYVDNEI